MPDPVLLMIDIQNDYFKEGRMALPDMETAAGAAARLLARFREKGAPVIHVFHESIRPDATFFIKDTPGVGVHPSVVPLSGEIQIKKHFPNAFRQTALLDRLQSLDTRRLVICGAMTNMCIDASTRAAFDFGFDCTVISNACAARPAELDGIQVTAPQVHAAFLANLGAVYAKVNKVEQYLESF
jgi:nicotinamidase-related amidase